MLEYIGVKRFKTLLDASLPLNFLNVFSGLNSMGKSSIIQVLLLLRQSYERNVLPHKGLLLNGEYASVGTGRDALSIDSEQESIEFILNWTELDQGCQMNFDYRADSDLLPINPTIDIPDLSQLSLFNHQFRYLAADRLSPRNHHQLSEYHIRDLNSLGNHGEYTVHFIAEYGAKNIAIEQLQHPKANAKTLISNIDAWMSDISPGLKVRTGAQPQHNSATLSYAFVQGNETTTEFKPQNVGFGLSYVLPVVTCILSAKRGDLLVIENPESHLHPAGQAVMGRLCALAANYGVQLMVESHSDHFLNGVRVAVKRKLIATDKVGLFFLSREKQALNHESHIDYPKIDEDGRIDLWPPGFFDEWDNQLDQLL
jgi:predicted ATPase